MVTDLVIRDWYPNKTHECAKNLLKIPKSGNNICYYKKKAKKTIKVRILLVCRLEK